jgi:hypothetical protein
MTASVNSTIPDTDIFDGVFQPSLSLSASYGFGVFFNVFAFGTSLFFIWCDNQTSDFHRTIMHRMTTVIYWIGCVAVPLILMQGVLRITFGPMNPYICKAINNIAQKVVKNAFLLLLNVSILARYIYCCKLRNPFNVDDKFWCSFLTAWCLLAALIIHFCQILTQKRESSFYFICAGLDPTENAKLENKFSDYVEVLSIFIHLITRIKLWQAKRKLKPSSDLRPTNTRLAYGIADLDKKSFSNIIFNLGGVLAVTIFGAVATKYKVLTLDEMNIYPNYIFVHLIYVVGPPALAFGWNLAILFNRPDLRFKLRRAIKKQ